MRPTSEQLALPRGHRKANRRFTTDQRDTWVGSHMCAAEECGASEAFQKKCAAAAPDGCHAKRHDERGDGWRDAALALIRSCIGLCVCVLRYGLWLAMLVSAYAPFVEASSGKLDWMEESSY